MAANIYIEHEAVYLRRIANGDHLAFEVVFRYYRDKVFNIAYKLTGSREMADDIVQDIFLQVWLKRSIMADVQHFKAYLFTLSRNYIARYIKRNARLIFTQASENDGVPEEAADRLLQEKEYAGILQQAIARLPAQQAEVYRLSKQEGLKREEVAGIMGISPETVKAHLALAMRSIRAYCMVRLGIPVLVYLLIS
ncbi:sigma-70 family RNA polymerase sigma factor [Chitinophaga sp. CCNWLW40]|uniref:RNA polymerase sigma factor n=1 Tax=Chitinophaga sp. CCNWLW40 TaxID=3122070 RepID=UPI0030105760